jgi:3-methyladenine DNA glycosylase AlkD
MNFAEVMQALEEMGTAQNRKIYARHGVGGKMFGVSMANLKTFQKRIKKDQALAEQLWQSGNHDARYLATLIANPNQVNETLLDAWVRELDNYVIADAFTDLAAQTACARDKAAQWSGNHAEYVSRAGWHLLAQLAMKDANLPDDFFIPYLGIIQSEIHQRPNRARQGMNNALIAIGIRNPALMKKALEVAEIIGEVQVDHGETNCKTNFAPEYIQRSVAHKQSKGQWQQE